MLFGAWGVQGKALAVLAWLCVFASAGHALADIPKDSVGPSGDAPEFPEPTPIPNWSIRVGVALGAPVQSDQEELLELEGYGGPRWALSLAGARKLTENVGAGLVLFYGWRSADASSDDDLEVTGTAPRYAEQLIALGAQVPLSLAMGEKRNVVVFFTPWAGAGFGKVEFGDQGIWQTGPAFGGSLGFFVPKAFFGAAFGAHWVPLPPPGEAGGHNDVGMLYFTLFMGADVG